MGPSGISRSSSSTDVMFWNRFVAMGGSVDDLEVHQGALIGYSGDLVMEIKLKKRWRHKWRTPMEVKVHLKGLQEACSKLWELEDIYFLFF